MMVILVGRGEVWRLLGMRDEEEFLMRGFGGEGEGVPSQAT